MYRETPPFGAFQSFHDGSTIATWLHDQGYTTGLFGKYIDAYQHAALTGYVPPGWDRWAAFVRSRYLDYKLTIDGHIQAYGDDASDYSTNVLGSLAERFIRDTPGPIFVEYAPAAPHAPAIPEARFQGAFAHLPPWRPPSYDEPDVSDKPTYIREPAATLRGAPREPDSRQPYPRPAARSPRRCARPWTRSGRTSTERS